MFVISISFLVCHSQMINKLMSVVAIRREHFMNSVFVNPGIFSCAVDAFLETLRICFYHTYQIYVLGTSLQTCSSTKAEAAIVNTISSLKANFRLTYQEYDYSFRLVYSWEF